MINNKFFTEIRSVYETPYIKVFFLNDNDVTSAKDVIKALNSIRKVNVTESKSIDHPGQNLTVYPKSMVDVKKCKKDVIEALNHFYSNTKVGSLKPQNDAHFSEIESHILEALDSAQATIDVCVAWFTNEKLKNKLLEKQKNGVSVRVIIYKDGTNRLKGVDLSNIEHKELRSEHGGIMHDKFCVIDNVITICGSYNWTLNAEKRNDEDVSIHKEDYIFASNYTRRFNEMWKRDEN